MIFYYFLFVYICVADDESEESTDGNTLIAMVDHWEGLEFGEQILCFAATVVLMLTCMCCCINKSKVASVCDKICGGAKKKDEIAKLTIRISPTGDFSSISTSCSTNSSNSSGGLPFKKRFTNKSLSETEPWCFSPRETIGIGGASFSADTAILEKLWNEETQSPLKPALPKIIDEHMLRRQISKENPALSPSKQLLVSPASTCPYLGSPETSWNLRTRMSVNIMTPGQYIEALDNVLLQEEAQMFEDLEQDIQTIPSSPQTNRYSTSSGGAHE